MVPVIDRLNYRAKLLGTPKVKAFLDLIETGIEGVSEVNDQSESDILYYSGLRALRACWGIEIIESRANFVVSKHQSHDQTMDAIDRLSMGRNRTGDPDLPFSTQNVSVLWICEWF